MSTLFGKSKRKRARGNEEAEESTKEQLLTHDNDNQDDNDGNNLANTVTKFHRSNLDSLANFEDLGLAEPLLIKCKSLGFKKPTPVQRTVIPFLLEQEQAHVLALAKTGSGKTSAFVLPILHRLALDPYGIYAVILTPTRELAKQIHQQVVALGSAYNVQSALVVGGLDSVQQSTALDKRPHFCVATPGRLAELLRGPRPPRLSHLRYLVLDEADRLLASHSGFERDVAELLLHCNGNSNNSNNQASKCQTLLFSATMTRSLESVEELAGGGKGKLPLQKFLIRDDDMEKKPKKKKTQQEGDKEDEDKDATEDGKEDGSIDDDDDDEEDDIAEALTPQIPDGLTQEYIFMPSRVRDAYLLPAIRKLMINGGRVEEVEKSQPRHKKGRKGGYKGSAADSYKKNRFDFEDESLQKARLAIIFVSTCERAAMVSCILEEVGVANVALHSLLSQNRRMAALGKFKSEQVRVLVATDVASRGLDIPTVDLVLNSELPRNTANYIHRVGRTARAGRRGRAISLVGESDVALVHAAERLSGRPLEKCQVVSDDEAVKMLGSVTKAARLAKMKLAEIGFDDLVKKFKERKVRDRKERSRIDRALRKQAAAAASSK